MGVAGGHTLHAVDINVLDRLACRHFVARNPLVFEPVANRMLGISYALELGAKDTRRERLVSCCARSIMKRLCFSS